MIRGVTGCVPGAVVGVVAFVVGGEIAGLGGEVELLEVAGKRAGRA